MCVWSGIAPITGIAGLLGYDHLSMSSMLYSTTLAVFAVLTEVSAVAA